MCSRVAVRPLWDVDAPPTCRAAYGRSRRPPAAWSGRPGRSARCRASPATAAGASSANERHGLAVAGLDGQHRLLVGRRRGHAGPVRLEHLDLQPGQVLGRPGQGPGGPDLAEELRRPAVGLGHGLAQRDQVGDGDPVGEGDRGQGRRSDPPGPRRAATAGGGPGRRSGRGGPGRRPGRRTPRAGRRGRSRWPRRSRRRRAGTRRAARTARHRPARRWPRPARAAAARPARRPPGPPRRGRSGGPRSRRRARR